MKKINKHIVFFCLLFWISAGLLSGCGVQGRDAVKEIGEDGQSKESQQNSMKTDGVETDGEEEETVEMLLSLADGEIRSIWTENGILYAFVASGDKEKPYGIYEIKDGCLLEETPYSDVMERWLLTEMEKFPASSYEYEAGLGRNEVVYLLGRDKEGNVKRCYWMEEHFYTDILFYEKYDERVISNIQISRAGKIFLENSYGGFMIPYDDFYGSIGFGVNWDTRSTVLGEMHMYQFTEGWIYVWDIPSGGSMEMIRCDVLNDGSVPVFVDEKDGIYLAGEKGLAYLPEGGSIWEILVDKDEEGFLGGAFDLKQIWVCEEELYLRGVDMETGRWQILKRKLPGKAVRK